MDRLDESRRSTTLEDAKRDYEEKGYSHVRGINNYSEFLRAAEQALRNGYHWSVFTELQGKAAIYHLFIKLRGDRPFDEQVGAIRRETGRILEAQ